MIPHPGFASPVRAGNDRPSLTDDAIMDRIVHNTIWVKTGGHNMREHTAGLVTV